MEDKDTSIVSICKLYKSGKLIGYRLLDLEKLSIKDVRYSSAVKNKHLISNMVMKDKQLEFIGSQSKLYPSYDIDTGEQRNTNNLVYVGKISPIMNIQANKHKHQTCNTNNFKHILETGFNHVSDFTGNIRHIEPMELQSLIVDGGVLNVAEGYTGNMVISEQGNHQELKEEVCGCCFVGIQEVYNHANKIAGNRGVKYKDKVYDIKKHKLVKETYTQGSIYKADISGVIDRGMYEALRSNNIICKPGKVPLTIEENTVYYISPADKLIKSEDVYTYMGDGLSGVLDKEGLLNYRSTEASFCIITANKYYILAMSGLVEFNREGISDKIVEARKSIQALKNKLSLIGNNNLILDKYSRVIEYTVKEDGDKVIVYRGIREFDLRNIKVNKGPGRYLYIDLVIPDEHGIIYVSEDEHGVSTIGGSFEVRSIECNDVALVKKLMEGITKKYTNPIEWKIKSSKVTSSLIKWLISKDNISLNIQGSLEDSFKDRVSKYIVSKDGLDIESMELSIKKEMDSNRIKFGSSRCIYKDSSGVYHIEDSRSRFSLFDIINKNLAVTKQILALYELDLYADKIDEHIKSIERLGISSHIIKNSKQYLLSIYDRCIKEISEIGIKELNPFGTIKPDSVAVDITSLGYYYRLTDSYKVFCISTRGTRYENEGFMCVKAVKEKLAPDIAGFNSIKFKNKEAYNYLTSLIPDEMLININNIVKDRISIKYNMNVELHDRLNKLGFKLDSVPEYSASNAPKYNGDFDSRDGILDMYKCNMGDISLI